MKKINFDFKKNIQRARHWFLGSFISHPLWKNWIALGILVVTLVLNITLWLILKKGIKPTSDLIPISYTIFGINKWGRWYEVFILPAIGLFIFLINLILSFIIYKKERFGTYLLLGTALVAQGFILISVICLVIFLS